MYEIQFESLKQHIVNYMATYTELKQQAEELMKQAEELRADERNAVLAEVRSVVAEWNFTYAELGFKKGGAVKKAKLPALYRDSSTGKEWCGRGAMPKWLSAHIHAGATKEQFLIA